MNVRKVNNQALESIGLTTDSLLVYWNNGISVRFCSNE